MSRSRRKELLWCVRHSEEETPPSGKVLGPKNGPLKTILFPDILRLWRNLRTWQQAADCLTYMSGKVPIHPCMYVLLVKRCIAYSKTRYCVINMTVTEWTRRLRSDMAHSVLCTGACAHSDDDGYWRAQPPLPYPREGVG